MHPPAADLAPLVDPPEDRAGVDRGRPEPALPRGHRRGRHVRVSAPVHHLLVDPITDLLDLSRVA